MTNANCGGCRGEGSHRRWCRYAVGPQAAMRGRWSEQAEALADEVGSNDPGRANILYQLAGFWLVEAVAARDAYTKENV